MGTTVQKLQRILETKTGFKNLITEKGGVITETTTFHEYIDEARKLMEGGKVVVEEASATAVPNSGTIDRVYFNTSLSTEEVDQIITNANLDWMDLETGAYAYAVCGTDTNNTVIIMAIPVSEGVYKYCIIGQGGSRDEPVISLAYVSVGVGPMMGVSGVEGWILDEGGVPDGFVSINGNLLSTDPGTKMPVGVQNEALKQLISTTPFSAGKQPVPNSGYVDTIKFNTSLSCEEVEALLDKLEYKMGDSMPLYIILEDSLSNINIMATKMEEGGMVSYAILAQLIEPSAYYAIYQSKSLEGVLGPGYGWVNQPHYETYPQFKPENFIINSEVKSSIDGWGDIGYLNNLITDLVYIESESFRKELSGTYEAITTDITENGEVDLTTYWDNDEMPIKVNVEVASEPVIIESDGSIPIPNNELVTELAFNTSLSPEEVDTIITNANLEYITDNGAPTYYAFYNSTLRLSQSNTGIILCLKEIGIASGLGKPAYMMALLNGEGGLFSYIYVSEGANAPLNFTGWNTSFLEGKRFNFNVMAESTYNNTSVGLQNDKLVKVFYALGGEPFRKELTGTYEPVTVEVTENGETDLTSYIDEQKMPIKVNVNVEDSGGIDYMANYLSYYYWIPIFQNFTGDTIDGILQFSHTSNITDWSWTFSGCGNIKTIPLLDTSKAEDMSYLFDSCYKLETIPEFDTSNVTTMKYMFKECSSLQSVPYLNAHNTTNMSYMFYKCSALTSIEGIDTSNAEDMSYMFQDCSSLETLPEMNTSKATNMYYMLNGCKNLVTIEGLDFTNVTNADGMFDTPSLVNANIRNISTHLRIGECEKLSTESLIGICKESINTEVEQIFFLNDPLREKMDNTYVKFKDPSVTTIPIGEKGDVEVCESTDEGAMTLREYMVLKNRRVL